MARILKRRLLSSPAAALLFLPVIALAEPLPCASHDDIVTLLAQQYKEAPEAMGITQDGVLLEVFVSETRSWTVLLTTATGLSCIAASGENWEREQRKPETGM